MDIIIVVVYAILGFWATKYTIYYNKIVIESRPGNLFIQRVAWGLFFGWALIPVALIRYFFFIRKDR